MKLWYNFTFMQRYFRRSSAFTRWFSSHRRMCKDRSISKDEFSCQHKNEGIIYIHWPYCEKRCTYCNFNKYISKNINHSRMSLCLEKELKYLLFLSGLKSIKSIYFGGGTPSLAKPETIYKLINIVGKSVTLQENAEITIECNPTSTESKLLRDFKNAGVNRVSIGIQALDDHNLKVLGRNHTSEDAIACLEAARQIFNGHVSIDLIFGRPGQNRSQWITELNQILKLVDDHISLYQLTLEKGTVLFKLVHNGEVVIPDDDLVTDMYEDAVQILTDAGFNHYEVSNYARNGAESQHNSSYWNGTQYIGIGPGAHGRFVSRGIGKTEREARIQILEPDNWMLEVERYNHGTRKITTQTATDILGELLMMGLRTKNGLHNTVWCYHSNGLSLSAVFETSTQFQYYISNRFLLYNGKKIVATEEGMKIADTITAELWPCIKNLQNTIKNN